MRERRTDRIGRWYVVRKQAKESVMLHDASKFYREWPETMNATKAANPDLGKAFGPFFSTLMKEGELDVRQKELIALGIAVATRCEPCIYAHVEKCLKHGASRQQIMEATGVAVMMGGGPAYTYAPIVVSALAHFEGAHAGA
jgi:AhpD family alkylhydroperoxidase